MRNYVRNISRYIDLDAQVPGIVWLGERTPSPLFTSLFPFSS